MSPTDQFYKFDERDDPNPEDLLDQVCDRESFLAFVYALAAERERAQQIESDHPDTYIVDGALGWMNGDIPHFLEAAAQHFESSTRKDQSNLKPTWRNFAEFLYSGKIIE